MRLAVYAKHPVYYQVPIFKLLYSSGTKKGISSVVLYGDSLSLKKVYFKECCTEFMPDAPFLLDGYKYSLLPNMARESRSGFMSRINPQIARILFRKEYDVLLVHGYETFTAWLAVAAAKLAGVKIIWRGESVMHGNEDRFSFKTFLKNLALKFFFRQCDSLLYSCYGNREFLEYYGASPEKMFFIPCAVDNDLYMQKYREGKKQRVELRKELGFADDECVFIFAARLTKRKRLEDLLKAVAEVKRNCSVLVIGDGPERERLEGFCREKNIKSVWAGFVQPLEVTKYYSAADVFVIISDYDPSPKALNEAMNFSLPVIATSVIGTARDLVSEGDNGFLVDVGDVKRIADKIAFLSENRQERERMGARSGEIVRDFSIERDVDAIFSAVEFVTGQKLQETTR